jgi:hypothetical protein
VSYTDAREEQPIKKLARLKTHDHVCLIHDSPEDWRAQIIVPFIELGLNRGEKYLYIVESYRADQVRGYLHKALLKTRNPFRPDPGSGSNTARRMIQYVIDSGSTCRIS